MRINKVVEILSKEVGTDYLSFISGEILNPGMNDCRLSEKHGSVYGIAVRLDTIDEKQDIFSKRDKKDMKIDEWISIGDNYYPLYWGESSYLGARLQDHTKEHCGKWTIQLNERIELKNKQLIYATVLCSNAVDIEERLRKNYPDIYCNIKGKNKKPKT